jgi:hypothetical protein
MRVEVKRKSQDGLTQEVFTFYFTDDCIGPKLWLDGYRLCKRVDKKRRFGKADKYYNRIDNRGGNVKAQDLNKMTCLSEVIQEAKDKLKKRLQEVKIIIR